MERDSARATNQASPSRPPYLPPHRLIHPMNHPSEQQRSSSPSCPASTAWDSRSSRKTDLPPCQRGPASPPLALLVHSTEASDPLAVTTKHWQQPSQAEQSQRAGGGGREGGEGRKHTPLQLSSSLNQCYSSSLSRLPLFPIFRLPFAFLFFAMTSSFPAWPRLLTHIQKHTRAVTSQLLPTHTHLLPLVSSVNISPLFQARLHSDNQKQRKPAEWLLKPWPHWCLVTE